MYLSSIDIHWTYKLDTVLGARDTVVKKKNKKQIKKTLNLSSWSWHLDGGGGGR